MVPLPVPGRSGRLWAPACAGEHLLWRTRGGDTAECPMTKLLLVSVAALLAAAPANAKHAALKWMDGPPGLPSGSKFAVVSGDPGKEGPFTVRIRVPANYAVPAPVRRPLLRHERQARPRESQDAAPRSQCRDESRHEPLGVHSRQRRDG